MPAASRLRALLVALAVAGCLATVATAGSSWVHRETEHWRMQLPNDDWNSVDGKNGTDITSPLGELYVAIAFAGWNYPLRTDDIVNLGIRLGTLDAHPLSSLRISKLGGATHPAPGQTQQVYVWTAFRTDRRERARGNLKVNVYNSPATGVYAYSLWTRTAPAAQWARVDPTLRFIQNSITYKPRSNAACSRPGCRPLR